MRALFSCTGGYGHFRPLIPLAHAFVDAGHDVVFATPGSFVGHVEAAGFSALAAGIDQKEVRARVAPVDVELKALPPLERRPLAFSSRFGRIAAPAKAAELHAAAEAWKPDLVVFESADLAAPIVAAALGIPSVHHGFGRIVPLECFERAAIETDFLWADFGLAPEPLGGVYNGLYLDLCPASFQTATVPEHVRAELIRPEFPPDPGETLPTRLQELPDRQTVYVTLGTVFNETALLRVLLAALADLECNLIATIGRNNEPDGLGPLPANAAVEQYVAQSLVLPMCAATVAHGGSGSTLAALAYGVPMLLVPQGADQFENAGQCAAIGAARVLMPGEVTAEAVRAGVVALLEEPSYPDSAAALAAEIAAMPAPEEVVDVLLD